MGEGAPLFLNVLNSKRDRSPDVVHVGDEWSGGFFVFFERGEGKYSVLDWSKFGDV